MVQPYGAQAPQGAGWGGGPGPATGQYEFNETENAVIGKTATRATLWGAFSLIAGVLMLLLVTGAAIWLVATTSSAAPLLMLVVALPMVIVYVAIGWSYVSAGRSLSKVVDTAGNDVQLLMNGLGKISTAFKIEVIVMIIAFVLGIIAVIGVIVFMGVMMSAIR